MRTCVLPGVKVPKIAPALLIACGAHRAWAAAAGRVRRAARASRVSPHMHASRSSMAQHYGPRK